MMYLASASPRRKDLLQQIGVRFEQLSVAVDETPGPDEAALDYVCRLAQSKAEAGFSLLSQSNKPLAFVLGSDTSVVLDQRILGKPQHQQDAVDMLLALSGRCHQVITAVALVHGPETWLGHGLAEVKFCQISEQQAVDYWHSGEPQDKAGGYAIQGLGAVFVERISGSYSAVVGLPLFETAELLKQANIAIWNREE